MPIDSTRLFNEHQEISDALDRDRRCDGWERMTAEDLAALLRKIGKTELADDLLAAVAGGGKKMLARHPNARL
jgi:hypothetical protein